MSKGNQLFVRGTDCEIDDTLLVKAYEKSMRSYRPVDMAQRIAMSTNTKTGEGSKPAWRAGAPCRAVSEDDGEEYEAYIVEVLDKTKCVVRFVGYGDSATVKLADLTPSHGNSARTEQMYNITTEPPWDEIMKPGFSVEESALDSGSSGEGREAESSTKNKDPVSDDAPGEHPQRSGRKKSKKSKKWSHKRKNSNTSLQDALDPPEFNGDTAGFSSMLQQLPLPPPPLLGASAGLKGAQDSQREVLNKMLMSWYMTGYYAGIYESRLKKMSKKPL